MAKNKPASERLAFTTSRLSEYFSVKELTAQIGCGPSGWKVAIAKELIDNALDACEAAGVPPVIEVSEYDDGQCDLLVVEDNGPGIPPEVIRAALDYSTRTSTNSRYVGPTRGQLGNALKCLFAMPGVLFPGEGRGVTIEARGVRHRVVVSHDPIADVPTVSHQETPVAVKTGTLVEVAVPEEASSATSGHMSDFYHDEDDDAPLESLARSFAFFNPHAEIRFWDEPLLFGKGQRAVEKWNASDPTSAHWYDAQQLATLAAAMIHRERQGQDPPRSVRDFVRIFDGLSGTAKAKSVLARAGLTGAMLADLAGEHGVNEEAIGALLLAMQENSRPREAKHLGWLGEDTAKIALFALGKVDLTTFRYRRILGATEEGRPFVVEAAFAAACDERPLTLRYGMNWTPSLSTDALGHATELGMIERHDPVMLAVHVVTPLVGYTDRGKRTAHLPLEIRSAILAAVIKVTAEWQRLKKRKARDERVTQKELKELSRPGKRVSLKEAAWQVMAQAHAQVVGGRVGAPAHARQLMYAARKLMLPLTNGRCWKRSANFTQQYLPQYLEAHPEETAGWNVVFDSRGELIEPHGGQTIGMGTVEVREYLRQIAAAPCDRYRFVLMVEKAGFEELFEHEQIADRFDLALAWTKGMTTTACRELIDGLSGMGITTLILHDFDKVGLSIAHTCCHNSKRYTFRNKPLVVDFGLRLADALAMGLEGEEVRYKNCKKDPRQLLSERGVLEAERNYLVSAKLGEKTWAGRRVELNEPTIDQLIGFLEQKLTEAGVTKVVPEQRRLEELFDQAWRAEMIERRIAEARRKAEVEVADLTAPTPDRLAERVNERIAGTPLDWRAGLKQEVDQSLPPTEQR
jgi:DNA topoisomerase VI subunit B